MAISIRAEKPPIREGAGVLRIGESGVTLETVTSAFLEGTTPQDIADQFPSVTLAEVYDVIAYAACQRQ